MSRMSRNIWLISGSLVAIVAIASADTPAPKADPKTPPKVEPHKAGAYPNSILLTAADLKWNDVPGYKGFQMAVAEGDPKTGPSQFFLKFAGGFMTPLHHHTADHYGAILSGTFLLGVGGKEKKLGPGSYFSIINKEPHTTGCAPGPECLVYIHVPDKWDVLPEAPAKPAVPAPAPVPKK